MGIHHVEMKVSKINVYNTYIKYINILYMHMLMQMIEIECIKSLYNHAVCLAICNTCIHTTSHSYCLKISTKKMSKYHTQA